MSATTIDELQVLISANAAAFQREMKNVRAELGQIGRSAKESTGSVAGGFIKAQLALGGLKAAFGVISGVAQKGIKEFGSLEQNLGGAEAVFGQFSDTVKQAAKDSAKTMGTSMSQYLGSANKMGSLFQGAGLSVSDSMQMTTTSMQRAADVASVMGISQEMALESIAGMAKGNFTMMDNLGVAMNDTALSAWMLERGIAGNVNQMAIGEKVGIAYQMFMDRTSKYAGNFAREATTLEGSLAIMRAELSNVAATLGMAFAPMVSSAASFVSNVLVPAINAVIPYVVALGNIINQVAASVFSFIGGIFGASKGISGVGSSSKSASNAMKNLGASAGGAGGGMGGAAKGAKALKKELAQLAKFDEMNVLKSPEEPSGGSGGSGGGGGAPALEMPEMSFGKFNSGFDEISAKAKKIADEIKKYFEEMFDFKKIGDAFKRFWDDIKKGASPVFKVVADIWKSYLEPFVKWAGNDLLPAFLNALGGAINFVGQVIGQVWGSFLKPFIDNFIAPIVNFTGSIIVGVLNGIGDALRGMAANSGVVEMFSNLIAVVGTGIAIWQGYQFVLGVVAAAKLALTGVMVAGTAASGAYAAGIGAVSIAQNLAATASGALSGVLTTLTNPAFLAVAAAAAAVVVAMEAYKLSQAEAKLAEEQRIDAVKLATQNDTWHKEAIQGKKDALDEIKNAELEAVNTELALINANERAKQARDAHTKAVNSGTYSTEELRKKELEAIQAEGLAAAAKKKHEESQKSLTDANDQYVNQVWKEIATSKQSDLQKLAQAGKYDELRQKLIALSKETITYTDKNGKSAKLSQQDTKAMADFIAGQLARINDGNGKTWKSIWESANQSVDKLNNVPPKFTDKGLQAGRNFGDGTISGIASKNGATYNAGWNQADQGVKGFKARLQIHSPSRVMKKEAGFFGEGVAIGINNSISGVVKETTNMASQAVAGFTHGINDEQKTVMNALSGLTSGFKTPTLSIRTDFSNMKVANLPDVSSLNRKIQQDFEVSSGLGDLGEKLDRLNEKPQQIVVKIGEEKLVDKLIDGINENSFLRNESMINL